MRFHVLGLPHTETTQQHLGCAYTQKITKFCRMMMSLGHAVYLYAGERNEAPCTEHIICVTRAQQLEWFGAHDNDEVYAPSWNPTDPSWHTMNTAAITAMRDRVAPRDFICVIAGTAQEPVVRSFPQVTSVEYGIGYEGIIPDIPHVYESHAHMAYVQGKHGDDNGHAFDAVIPNYFDTDDFFASTRPIADRKYLLWIGRFVRRKGPDVALDIARGAGQELILAGQGARVSTTNGIDRVYSDEITIEGEGFEHVGPVDARTRGELMANARAVIVPTSYLEPFGGVAVEAMLCGTPIITTDWGAFPEYNHHGITGYRFRTLAEGVWAAKNVDALDPKIIREYAIANFSLERVRWLYDEFFKSLLTLWGDGWYAPRDVDPTRYVAGINAGDCLTPRSE